MRAMLSSRDIDPTAGLRLPSLIEEKTPLSGLDRPTIERIQKMDAVRKGTLYWLLGLFTAVLIFGATASVIGGAAWADAKDFLNMVLAGVTGFLGTAIGFY